MAQPELSKRIKRHSSRRDAFRNQSIVLRALTLVAFGALMLSGRCLSAEQISQTPEVQVPAYNPREIQTEAISGIVTSKIDGGVLVPALSK